MFDGEFYKKGQKRTLIFWIYTMITIVFIYESPLLSL